MPDANPKKRSFVLTLLAGMALAAGPSAWGQARPAEERAFSLDGATGWLNSPPLDAQSLRGKVVLVEFWTYSCINWRREFAHVRAWADKYRDRGLVVVGVHSPEFSFEKEADNVRRAAKEIGVHNPVAIDSEHRIWRAFGNAYWPALYFIDAEGRIRRRHFGEGDYEASEEFIQRLLAEAGATEVRSALGVPAGSGAEAPADWANLRSPEIYLGAARSRPPPAAGAAPDQSRVFEAPAQLGPDRWGLAGEWTLQDEAAVLNRANGRIAVRFHARDLHLVMGPAAPGDPVPFRVTIDGRAPGPAHGVDSDDQGRGTLAEARMYQLIRQSAPIEDRRFEIEFLRPGVAAYSFTFG